MHETIQRLQSVVIQHIPRPHALRNFTEADLRAQAAAFGDISFFKGCIGLIDSTSIPMRRPKLSGQQAQAYFNAHKKFHAMKLQAVVDHRGLFIDYAVGAPGSMNDSRLYKYSQLDEHLKIHASCKGLPPYCYLIGDGAYAADTCMVRPYRRTKASARQLKFNSILSSLSALLETCSCILICTRPSSKGRTLIWHAEERIRDSSASTQYQS